MTFAKRCKRTFKHCDLHYSPEKYRLRLQDQLKIIRSPTATTRSTLQVLSGVNNGNIQNIHSVIAKLSHTNTHEWWFSSFLWLHIIPCKALPQLMLSNDDKLTNKGMAIQIAVATWHTSSINQYTLALTGPTQRRVRREDEVNGIKISALLRGHTEANECW